MNTMEIAEKMIALCREGKNADAVKTLFADDCESIEAGAPPGTERAVKGIPAILGKTEWWLGNHEIHSSEIFGPWPHDDRFIVGFKFDVTNKPSGMRMQMDEVGLYTVKDGKIVREEFFYHMPGM